MISICPICNSTYNHNPEKCSCGYEGIEVYIHEKKDEYWNKQLFQIYKYTKNVYYKRISHSNSILHFEENDHQVLIRDIEENKGLCIIEYDSDKETIADMGVLALNRKVRSLIINVDNIDTNFLDESIVNIIFFGSKVKSFTKGYIQQHSALKYLFVDPNNQYFTSQNHVLFSKDMSELVCYPSDFNEKEYTVPTSVKKINPHAFGYLTYLKKIYISKNVSIDEQTIQRLKEQEIEIEKV